jgi:hypothetical protein
VSRPVVILPVLVLILCGGKVAADVIDGEELVDPTRPFYFEVSANGETEALRRLRNAAPVSYDISFIRASDSSPVAIINEQRVTLGDVIGGATVVAIDRSSVTLLINEEEQRINLYSDSVKSPARNR